MRGNAKAQRGAATAKVTIVDDDETHGTSCESSKGSPLSKQRGKAGQGRLAQTSPSTARTPTRQVLPIKATESPPKSEKAPTAARPRPGARDKAPAEGSQRSKRPAKPVERAEKLRRIPLKTQTPTPGVAAKP